MGARTFVQTQVFVGPLWEPAGADCAWDWGRTQDLDLAGVKGKITSRVLAPDSSLLYSGFILPPKGGFWLGPGVAGQGWEYIAYGSAGGTYASGLRREPASVREHNGVHEADAVLQMWAQLEGDDGKLHIIRETNDTLCATKWSAEISGVAAPRAFLRRHHAVLVRQRESHLLPWEPLLLGWIDEYSVDDDFSKVAKWKVRVVSSAGMLEKMAVPPLRSGELDLCQYGKIIVQDVQLASVHKEWGSGDFVAASPDVSAKAAIDGDENTAWIPERVLGFETDGEGNDLSIKSSDKTAWGEIFVVEMNLGTVPGLGKGYRWIQFGTTVSSIGDFRVFNKTGNQIGALIDLGGSAGTASRIFLVENLNLFSAHNPLANPTRIVEVGAGWFDAFDLNSDALGIWGSNNPSFDPTKFLGPAIKWGNDPDVRIPSHEGKSCEMMAGPCLQIPMDGKVLAWRRKTDGTPVGTWWYAATTADTAGYDPGETRPYPFFMVQLPTMGLALKTDVTGSYSGLLECWDGKTTHVNGLPASGIIQIGSEQMRYDFKTKTAINIVERGYGLTDPTAHQAEDSVLVVENGQATDGFQVRQIRWKRREGKSHPSHFKIWGSGFAVQPRHPVADDEDPNYEFEMDFTKYADEQWYAANEYTIDFSQSPKRMSWLLFQISLMNVQPSRARVDSFEAILDTTLLDPDCWLPEGATLLDALAKLLHNAGVPASAITMALPLPFMDAFKVMTAYSNAWSVLTDLADYSGCYVNVDLLSHITISTNVVWRPELSQYPHREWDRSNLATVQFIAERSTPTAQVQMERLNPDGTTAETLVYPTQMDAVGVVQQMKATIYPSHDTAMAALERRYLLAKYSYTIGLQTALGQDDLAPGEVNSVSWAFGDPNSLESATAVRTGIVRDVEHTIEGLAWKTAARLVLYREVY